jgi:homoaconitase/3-isopropylmalate dehydratase large subunit
MGTNLFNKIWDLHRIRTLPDGMDQIFIGLHLLHEVTSPQAFRMLEQTSGPGGQYQAAWYPLFRTGFGGSGDYTYHQP